MGSERRGRSGGRAGVGLGLVAGIVGLALAGLPSMVVAQLSEDPSCTDAVVAGAVSRLGPGDRIQTLSLFVSLETQTTAEASCSTNSR